MTEKRLIVDDDYNWVDTTNGCKVEIEDAFDLVNKLWEENEQLKTQLYYNGDSVCNICKHQYLVETEKYYVAKCKKGHEQCSKEDVKHCKDFER